MDKIKRLAILKLENKFHNQKNPIWINVVDIDKITTPSRVICKKVINTL